MYTAHLRLPHVSCVALGTRITGVDDHTFSSTGESFSMIGGFAIARFLAFLGLSMQNNGIYTELSHVRLLCVHSPAQQQLGQREEAPGGQCLTCVRVCQEGKCLFDLF
jgi:hypothetical protein